MWKLARRLAVLAIPSLLLAPLRIACLPSITPAQDTKLPTQTQNKAVGRELSKDESHSYPVTLESGQYLNLRVEQRGIEVGLALRGPDGRKLLELNCRQSGATPVSLIAGASGTYVLEVRSLEKVEATGSYEVTVEEIRPATARDGSRIAAESSFADAERFRADQSAESNRKAIRRYAEALSYWQASDDKSEAAKTLEALGQISHLLDEPKKAIEYYNQALLLSKEIKDLRAEGEILNALGLAYIDLGDNQQASEYCTRALQLSRDVRNRRGEADALNNIGEVYNASGELKKALEYYQQALPIWRALRDRRGQAQTILHLGQTYSDLGDTRTALDSYQQSLGLWHTVSDRRGEALTLIALGHLYHRSGENQDALDIYQRAMPLVETLGDSIWKGSIIGSTGVIYEALGEQERALEYYNQALRLFQAVGYTEGIASTLVPMGRAYYSIGRTKEALEYCQRALKLIKSIADRRLEPYALRYLGAISQSIGQSTKALEYYNQALSLYEAGGDRRGEAYALDDIGSVYYGLSEKQKALDYYRKALPLNRATGDRFGETSTLFDIARVERDIGSLADARAHIETALSIIEKLRVKVADQELRASYLATVQQDYELLIDVLMQQHNQRPSDGLDAAALHTSERARARSLLEMLAEAHADIRQGVDATLLERERLLQLVLSDKAERYSRLLTTRHTEEQATDATKEIEASTADYQQVRAQIRATSPRYAALTQPQPLSLKEIQQQVLDSDTLLLEYALGDQRSYLWAVTRDSIASFELAKRADIESAARRVYDLLTASNQTIKGETQRRRDARLVRAEAGYVTAAAGLSRMLLGPIASQLGLKRLLIVADGALQYIPFAALPTPKAAAAGGQLPVERKKPERKNPNHRQLAMDYGPPLVVEHEIVSLPSASALAVLRRELVGRKPAAKGVAVLADPVFSSDDPRLKRSGVHPPRAQASSQTLTRDFRRAIKEAGASGDGARLDRLLFSRREADAIMTTAPSGDAMQAVDFDASRATALSPELSQYRILHFATHGLLDSEHPELSGIVFSLVDRQGRPQNGFVRGHEVYNLNLPADLVVLSACQTALGKEVKGEGLVGLTRGFMYAGAARVMASLWKVDDQATAELMKRFYGKMLKEGLSPAAALRASQVEMSKRQRWESPYYWAAFILQGEWR